MKSIIVGLFTVLAVVQASVVQVLPSSTASLVRTPSFDSAVVHSARHNGAFSYSTVENHGYAHAVHHQVPVYRTYNLAPQVQQVYYAYQPPVYSVHPSYITNFSGIPFPAPGVISQPPVFGGFPIQAPGVNPQIPIEVASPADNAPIDGQQGSVTSDDDTVSIESA
ncbi:CLUMA_CG005299, isoform A [Clunio marinus]|uniref:CLUMA_CG005299, isoform A n=1 Tax=Clunio marinus TaxID=568069 RepID=A0A1J1HZU1_9DIPT|nr:CLUMA_CG005299, isoform A [Clunio marinus]